MIYYTVIHIEHLNFLVHLDFNSDQRLAPWKHCHAHDECHLNHVFILTSFKSRYPYVKENKPIQKYDGLGGEQLEFYIAD